MYDGVAEKMSVSVHSDSQLTTASQANRFLFYLALCFCVRYPMHLITLMDHSSAASPVYCKQQHVNCAEVFQELNLPWYNLQPFHSLHQSKTRGGGDMEEACYRTSSVLVFLSDVFLHVLQLHHPSQAAVSGMKGCRRVC